MILWGEPEGEWWFGKELKRLGESQGVPKWLSPNERFNNSKLKFKPTENQEKKEGAKTRLSPVFDTCSVAKN